MQEKEHTYLEIIVGVFVAIGIGALILLCLQVSGFGSKDVDGYKVSARFSNVGQLRSRAPVRLSGVNVGLVNSVSIDPESFEALVTMEIDDHYDNIPTDTGAGIYTSGLLGEQYVSLLPGAEEEFLEDGDEIEFTSSAIVLEEVIGRLLFSKAAGDNP